MGYDTHSDLVVLHRYLDAITTFIASIIKDEKAAIVLACKVFEEHKKRNENNPFTHEGRRKQWLHLKARNLAIDHLNLKRQQAKEAHTK